MEQGEESKDKTKPDESKEEKEKKTRKVYLPGTPLDKGESLVYDPSAYVMLHEAQTGAPCLSFDIIKDELGDERTAYPQTLYAVAGTQSKKFNFNRLIVMKMSNLTSTEEDNERELEDDESEGSGDEDRRKDPVMNSYFIRHRGCINRVRSSYWPCVITGVQHPTALQTVDDPFQLAEHNKKRGKGPGIPTPPLFSFSGHLTEGFAMDWSSTEPGVLATGDCKRNIHIWTPREAGAWQVDQKPLGGHTNSAEDLQWSDLKTALQTVDDPFQLAEHNKKRGKGPGIPTPPLFSFSGHLTEGFAMDWSSTEPGVLATGDCKRNIHIWTPREAGAWQVDQKPLVGHTNSVEDLQWSPGEKRVLASCSVDLSIRIWDTRVINTKSCMLTLPNAHTSDVNVISWNRTEPLIVSGGDDGCIHVWDLRRFKKGSSVATFKHHTAPVTTVEWHPTESSTFASGGADDQIALWDLAVERDSEIEQREAELKDLPSQLLFIHLGQKEIKELHWHPQLPGTIISTANSGFNIFRTISV
ncbi:glutamate-rich WD repeat-containing protein 1 [Diaphorina citri]|uniref:Glutamate-rich WD repeat-containing protein 1 n=1 Tax=Diaphorina citri TaxID=121845 RepID=A0A3Q0JBM6_DIACI|nr:glutamate-rich WD repeat-containing protein 1 [Diaphorina citri]